MWCAHALGNAFGVRCERVQCLCDSFLRSSFRSRPGGGGWDSRPGPSSAWHRGWEWGQGSRHARAQGGGAVFLCSLSQEGGKVPAEPPGPLGPLDQSFPRTHPSWGAGVGPLECTMTNIAVHLHTGIPHLPSPPQPPPPRASQSSGCCPGLRGSQDLDFQF